MDIMSKAYRCLANESGATSDCARKCILRTSESANDIMCANSSDGQLLITRPKEAPVRPAPQPCRRHANSTVRTSQRHRLSQMLLSASLATHRIHYVMFLPHLIFLPHPFLLLQLVSLPFLLVFAYHPPPCPHPRGGVLAKMRA